MSHKKADHQEPSEEQVLIDKVDAMMDLERQHKTEVVSSGPAASALAPAASAPASAEPIDIFKDLKTEPPTSGIEEEPAEPKPVIQTQEPTDALPDKSPDAPPNQPADADQSTDQPLPPLAENVADNNPDLDDTLTEQAVEEVVLAESDALLAAEDIIANNSPPIKPANQGFKVKVKRLLE